ncbi:hypothetical protein SGLAM104S_06520 [Streptomyces glaucescens]
MALLAPDVRLVGDSGGKSRAPLRILRSADKVGRFLLGAAEKRGPMSFRMLEVNGGPAILAMDGDRPDSVFQLDVLDGRVQSVYIIRTRQAAVLRGRRLTGALPDREAPVP